MLQRVAMMAALVPLAAGHGYLQTPVSRNYGCKTGLNSKCGGVQWEPQSVEGPDGYPSSTGPEDGALASAGAKTRWQALNAVGGWGRVAMQPGSQEFAWRFTAPHSTRDFRYYITRNGWAQDMPLARSSFEATPFCEVSLHNAKANTKGTHRCDVPHRSGYHVLLAVWDVADTAASFYNVADLDFGGSGSVPVPVTSVPVPPVPVTSVPVPPVPVTAGPLPGVPSQAPTFRTQAPSVATDVPSTGCAGRAVPAWGNCHMSPCCVSGWRCHRQSQWYAQCIPN